MSKRKERLAEQILQQIKRAEELDTANWKFVQEHGRQPTHRELWAVSPPK